MGKKRPEKPKSATIHVVKDKPKQPKTDRGDQIEQHLRQMYKTSVDVWIKRHWEEEDPPDRETKGLVVDNLIADFASSFETLIEATTNSYLSTALFDEDEDDDDSDDESDDGDAGDDGADDGDDVIDADFD